MSTAESSLERLRSIAISISSSGALLSDDGLTLNLNDTSFDATVIYSIPAVDDNGSCKYSLASLYLVCMYPDSLLDRRRASKKSSVDIVLNSHLKQVKTFFGLLGTAAAAPAAADDNNNTTMTNVEDDDRMDIDDEMDMAKPETSNSATDHHHKRKDGTSSSSSKRHHDDRKSSKHHRKSEKDRKDRRSGKHSSSKSHHQDKPSLAPAKPKDKTPITNAQVMQNLSFLNDKQQERLKRKEEAPPALGGTAATNATADTTNDQNKTAVDDGKSTTTQSTDDSPTAETTADTTKPTDTATNLNTIPKKAPQPPHASTSAAPKISPTTSSPKNTAAIVMTKTVTTATEERQKNLLEKVLISEALSPEGFQFSDEQIASDREATEKITAMETPVGDSASILRFTSNKDSFSRVLGLYLEVKRKEDHKSSSSSRHHQQHKRPKLGGSSSSNWDSSKSSSKSSSSTRKKPVGLPLIIVPNAMTAPIGLVNAKEFFHDKLFVPRDRVKKTGSRISSFTFARNLSSRLGGFKVEYEVMDNPSRLKREEWERIVAVVPLGEMWQFKNWRWKQPVEIFDRCFGFYIGIEGAPMPKDLMGWNVKKAQLNRDKRGLDSVAHAMFWNSLDEWMVLHKREYLPEMEM